MFKRSNSNLWLGLACLCFALITIFVWIPLDTDTGLVEKVRRRLVVGDALAPTVASVFVALGGLGLLLFERNDPDQPRITQQSLRFVVLVLGILVSGFLIMRVTGPLAVELVDQFTAADMEYRLLRDTAPWKYLGFMLGGTFVVTSLVAQLEGRLTLRGLLIGVVASIVLIVVYDLPFDDLLLPPNGDV